MNDYKDELNNYKEKIKRYSLSELEDIVTHIDKVQLEDRYNILLEELQRKKSSKNIDLKPAKIIHEAETSNISSLNYRKIISYSSIFSALLYSIILLLLFNVYYTEYYGLSIGIIPYLYIPSIIGLILGSIGFLQYKNWAKIVIVISFIALLQTSIVYYIFGFEYNNIIKAYKVFLIILSGIGLIPAVLSLNYKISLTIEGSNIFTKENINEISIPRYFPIGFLTSSMIIISTLCFTYLIDITYVWYELLVWLILVYFSLLSALLTIDKSYISTLKVSLYFLIIFNVLNMIIIVGKYIDLPFNIARNFYLWIIFIIYYLTSGCLAFLSIKALLIYFIQKRKNTRNAYEKN